MPIFTFVRTKLPSAFHVRELLGDSTLPQGRVFSKAQSSLIVPIYEIPP